MRGSFAGGLAAALGGAVLYGSAPVAQAIAARRTRGGGLGLALTLRLARRPIWLLGLGCEIGAFVLEAFAFSVAPATLVAPIMGCDMLVFVLLAWPVFGERLTGTGAGGALVIGAAIALLAVAFSGTAQLGSPADDVTLLAFLGACVAASAIAAVLGGRALRARRRTVAAGVFGVASGIAYGFATMATRQVGRTFVPGQPWELFAAPTPYVLIGCSILGITMMQRGLQTNPIFTFPLTSAISAFLPAVLGAVLLGDEVPSGARLAAFVLALASMGGGLVLMGQARSSAHHASERVSPAAEGKGSPDRTRTS